MRRDHEHLARKGMGLDTIDYDYPYAPAPRRDPRYLIDMCFAALAGALAMAAFAVFVHWSLPR